MPPLDEEAPVDEVPPDAVPPDAVAPDEEAPVPAVAVVASSLDDPQATSGVLASTATRTATERRSIGPGYRSSRTHRNGRAPKYPGDREGEIKN
jgi:hypothetical protein